jgi:hypothetical protein
MWYSVDFPRLALMLLPVKLRRPAYAALAQIAVKPVEQLHYTWGQWRDSNIYKLTHTGQVCYLRGALNDTHDPSLRRIYIGPGNEFNATYLHTEAEAQDDFANKEDENGTMWLRTEAETVGTGLDFTVWVPQEIYYTQLEALHATISFYKAAGRRYQIKIIP